MKKQADWLRNDMTHTGGTKFYKKKSRSWQAIDLQPKIQMYLVVTVDSKRISIDAYDVNDVIIDSVVLE